MTFGRFAQTKQIVLQVRVDTAPPAQLLDTRACPPACSPKLSSLQLSFNSDFLCPGGALPEGAVSSQA